MDPLALDEDDEELLLELLEDEELLEELDDETLELLDDEGGIVEEDDELLDEEEDDKLLEEELLELEEEEVLELEVVGEVELLLCGGVAELELDGGHGVPLVLLDGGLELEVEEEGDDEEGDPCEEELLTRIFLWESKAMRTSQPDDRHILPPDRDASTRKLEEYRMRGIGLRKMSGLLV